MGQDKDVKNYIEKKLDTRKRSDSEFMNSLEIVKDSKKIKNICPRMGYSYRDEDLEKYNKNYERAFGHVDAKKGSTGTYKWDSELNEFVKISDKTPSGGLVTL